MRILVIGGGGREHALAWKLSREPSVQDVICAPGNAGIGRVARLAPVSPGDVEGLLALALHERVDLTVVGPELPLDLGIVDLFRTRGLRIFGPSRAAARLECSKAFAKAFMARHGVPTARYRVCDDSASARGAIRRGELGFPVVVKADGLAAGKGVVVAPDPNSADAAVTAAMDDRRFGDAGARVVLEEYLTGPEVSFFALCDGARAVPLAAAQDHKRVFDGDEGPNTGGMGAFAPSPLLDSALQARVMREVIDPVVAGLRTEQHQYCGVLYAGLMLTADGPKVIEFNVRFGDPEAQVVVPGIAGELAPHLAAAADGALGGSFAFGPDKHVGVVIASSGYPGPVSGGVPISGIEDAEQMEDVIVFHSATQRASAEPSERTVTSGGRVLTVVGRGASFEDAIRRAYGGVSKISFEGMHYRRDIGRKAL